MRQIKIKNSIGNEINLIEEEHFFSDPEGLGVEKEKIFIRAGESFREVSSKNKQGEISGCMNFVSYSNFTNFSGFLNYPPFEIYYMPIETWYKRKVVISYFEKSEINSNSAVLQCPIKFYALEKWRSEDKSFTAGTVTSGAGKTYPYTYSYTYSDNTLGAATIENETANIQCCKIIVDGPAENPSWVLTKDGNVIGDGKVNVTIPSGKRLIVNSDPTSYEIALYSSSNVFEENVYDKSDFSTKRFVNIPIGISTMSFAHEGSNEIVAHVEVSEFNELV